MPVRVAVPLLGPVAVRRSGVYVRVISYGRRQCSLWAQQQWQRAHVNWKLINHAYRARAMAAFKRAAHAIARNYRLCRVAEFTRREAGAVAARRCAIQAAVCPVRDRTSETYRVTRRAPGNRQSTVAQLEGMSCARTRLQNRVCWCTVGAEIEYQQWLGGSRSTVKR